MEEHKIIPMERRHVAAAKEAFSLAFINDPLTVYFEPNDAKRKRISPWFWGSLFSYGLRWGVAETIESGGAAAIWLPPGETKVPARRIFRTGFIQLPFRLGIRGILRFSAMDSAAEKAHDSQMPGDHWYLMAIAVHPDLQGQGVGSALIDAGHARADEAGLPCYLETATQEDIDFYSRRGYTIGEQFVVKDLNVTTMIKQPVTPASVP